MKKVIAHLICILLCIALSASTALSTGAVTSDIAESGKTVLEYGDWMLESIDQGTHWELDEYVGAAEELYTPRFYNSLLIVSVGDHCFMNNTTVRSVRTSSPLWRIGEYAFIDCTALERVELNFALDTIGVGAFSGTSSLKDINLQDSIVTEIKANTFLNSGIEEVALPVTCTSIGNYAFGQCDSLTKLVIPASVTSIHDDAFKGSDNLVIYCYTGSYAQSYAEDKGIPYVLLDAAPVWSWAEDFSSATASFDGGDILTASITKEFGSDSTTYKATVTHNGLTFTDSRVRDRQEFFASHSLSLNGDIAVNFYLNLTEEQAAKTAVSFRWNDQRLDGVPVTYDSSSGFYRASCSVAVAEMASDISVTLSINGVEQDQSDVYSVKRYANYILTDSYFATRYTNAFGYEKYQQLIALIKAMLDYGSRAQVRFSYDTANLANGGAYYFDDTVTADSITTTASNMNTNLSDYGLSYVGSSVVYLSKTSLRHYYRIEDQSRFELVENGVTFDGEEASAVSKDGMIYFEKSDIKAPHLDKQYTLSIGGSNYDFAVLDYVRLQLSTASVGSAAKELGKSAYRYNRAANAFFDGVVD